MPPTPIVAPWQLRTAAATALVLLLAVVPPAAGAPVLDPPVPGPVLAGFDAPTEYGPGHRGVDLGAPAGTPVRSPAPGTVTFAGRVVDAVWVTVDHGPVRTTVGPVAEIYVRRGQRVARGDVLGTSGRAHGTAAVHWSLRRGDTYLDPLASGRRVATLLPDRPARRSVATPGTGARPVAWHRLRVR